VTGRGSRRWHRIQWLWERLRCAHWAHWSLSIRPVASTIVACHQRYTEDSVWTVHDCTLPLQTCDFYSIFTLPIVFRLNKLCDLYKYWSKVASAQHPVFISSVSVICVAWLHAACYNTFQVNLILLWREPIVVHYGDICNDFCCCPCHEHPVQSGVLVKTLGLAVRPAHIPLHQSTTLDFSLCIQVSALNWIFSFTAWYSAQRDYAIDKLSVRLSVT